MTILRPAVLLGLVLALASAGRSGEAKASIILPPYLESVVFDVFTEEPAASVQVFSPGDLRHPLTPGAGGVEEIRLGNALKTLTVRRPAPGQWIIRQSHRGTAVRILSQQFLPRGLLVEPKEGEPVPQHERAFIVYRVMDENGSPLEELPGYPLVARLVLVQPDGRRLPLAMKRLSQKDPGVFRTRDRIECSLPGRYWTEVVLTTRDLAGKPVTVLQDRWSGFTVRPVGSRR